MTEAVPRSQPGAGPRPGADRPETLRPLASTLLLILYTLVYVIPLYISARTRPSPNISRDSPVVIQARIFSVTVSTAACSLATLAILFMYHREQVSAWPEPVHAMGWWPVGVTPALQSVFLVMILYTGPLFETLVVDGLWTDCLSPSRLRQLWEDWPTWRNLVAGPVTEELLFRSAAVPLQVRAGMPLTTIIFLTPVVFGLAHIHHFYEFRITHRQVPLSLAVLRSALQLTYTSLFGAYATFLFLRTGSLLAVVLVHTFCNVMGLPRLWGRLQPHWAASEEGEWKWTTLYYVLLVSGMVGWKRLLWTLTESPEALVEWK